MNIKTIFMGTPLFAVPILETLIKNTEVLLVVTQPDKEVGRKKVLTPPPVKVLAEEHNIPILQPVNIKKEFEEIKKYQPDLIVSCAYGQIIPKSILDIPHLGCINVHASILPKYRGGAPIHHALINGDEETGITLMYMDEGLDTGDIIDIAKIKIDDLDNVETLHQKLSSLGSEILLKNLPNIINKINKRVKQDNTCATYAPVIKREDEHLNFNKKAKDIYNQVRGLNSWPLANMTLNNEEYKVIEGYIGEDTKELPGTIANITKDAIGIACIDKVYYITKLKPFGKKEMFTKDYLNGISKSNLLKSRVS